MLRPDHFSFISEEGVLLSSMHKVNHGPGKVQKKVAQLAEAFRCAVIVYYEFGSLTEDYIKDNNL